MKQRILKPEQIIVPAECAVGKNSVLQEYFDIFNSGNSEDVTPIVVLNPLELFPEGLEKLKNTEITKLRFYANRGEPIHYGGAQYLSGGHNVFGDIDLKYIMFEEKLSQSPFCLIDGNHRAMAATLTNNPIKAYDLQSDEDFDEFVEMIEQEQIRKIGLSANNLEELATFFQKYVLGEITGLWVEKERYLLTVRERAGRLIEQGDIPQEMADRYSGNEVRFGK